MNRRYWLGAGRVRGKSEPARFGSICIVLRRLGCPTAQPVPSAPRSNRKPTFGDLAFEPQKKLKAEESETYAAPLL